MKAAAGTVVPVGRTHSKSVGRILRRLVADMDGITVSGRAPLDRGVEVCTPQRAYPEVAAALKSRGYLYTTEKAPEGHLRVMITRREMPYNKI